MMMSEFRALDKGKVVNNILLPFPALQTSEGYIIYNDLHARFELVENLYYGKIISKSSPTVLLNANIIDRTIQFSKRPHLISCLVLSSTISAIAEHSDLVAELIENRRDVLEQFIIYVVREFTGEVLDYNLFSNLSGLIESGLCTNDGSLQDYKQIQLLEPKSKDILIQVRYTKNYIKINDFGTGTTHCLRLADDLFLPNMVNTTSMDTVILLLVKTMIYILAPNYLSSAELLTKIDGTLYTDLMRSFK